MTVLPCSATFGADGMTLEFLILGPFGASTSMASRSRWVDVSNERCSRPSPSERTSSSPRSDRSTSCGPRIPGYRRPPGPRLRLAAPQGARRRRAADPGDAPSGYQLVLERGQVDLDRFEDHVAAARSATEEGRFAEASARLERRSRLARTGTRRCGIGVVRGADAERLNELRVAATEDLVGSQLAVGRDDLVPELKSLVA